ncbi:MAG TPA: YIP1 family protein [Anaerolineales bacterium]|jgi:hypothetical protein
MDKYSIPHPERESYHKHLRDVNRKIILPVVLVTVLVGVIAVLAGLAATGSSGTVSMWADISIIWLVIPMMMFAIAILALMIGLIYGLNRLLKISPYYTGMVQAYVLWFRAEMTIWADKLTRPVVSIRTWLDLLLKREG